MIAAAPTALLAVAAGAAVIIAIISCRAWPSAAFVAWVLVLFFVPVWVGVTVGAFWAAVTLMTLLMIAVNWSAVPLRVADLWIAAFVVVSVSLFALGSVTLSAMTIALLEWIVPYIWGRIVLARVGKRVIVRTIAIVAVVAAALTILEFALHFNPFVLIPGSGEAYTTWRPLQQRGGVMRAEGAFGHSIALGASLAMSTAFVVATRWRLVPMLLSVTVIGVATVVTFSRAALITLVVTLVLAVFFLPGVSARIRAGFVAAAVVAFVSVSPLLDSVFGDAGSDLEVSGDYRSDLVVLLDQVRLIGNAGDWTTRVSGDDYLGYFARSVDNALLVLLLRFGWIPTGLLVAALLCAALTVVRRTTRNPPGIAVVGQLPSLVVVALITQYGMFLWFCVGLALSWGHQSDREADRASASTSEPERMVTR